MKMAVRRSICGGGVAGDAHVRNAAIDQQSLFLKLEFQDSNAKSVLFN